ncbi:MAG: nucleotidyltransferase domain-containing protein [Chloroflexi bacterium]|nr:nucleotidyltransferase domain-containing protein [Chloroflexota bacterium]
MMSQSLLADMTGQIVRRFKPEKIILFGSQARGEARPASDVDLLVILSGRVDRRQAAVEIRRALSGFPVAKDILVATPDEIRRRGNLVGTVLNSALREGKVLYERD